LIEIVFSSLARARLQQRIQTIEQLEREVLALVIECPQNKSKLIGSFIFKRLAQNSIRILWLFKINNISS